MRIQLTLDPSRLWSWQACLARTLARKPGIELFISWKTPPAPLPGITKTLLLLDRTLVSTRLLNAQLIHKSALDSFPDAPANTVFDLCCNLTGHPPSPSSSASKEHICLTPVYDGFEDEQIALLALLDERAPLLGIRDSRECFATPLAEPTLMAHSSLAGRLEAVFALVQEMLLKFILQMLATSSATSHNGSGKSPPHRLPKPWPIVPPSRQSLKTKPVLRHLQHILTYRISRYLYKKLKRPKDWNIFWSSQPAALEMKSSLPSHTLTRQPGDSFKEPFPLFYGGQYHVFFTCYSPQTGRSSIACICTDQTKNGTSRKAEVRIVLERPYNISHPTLFEHDGQIWMIPVTADNKTVELYRAARFPDKWVFERMLFEDVSLHSITLYKNKGTTSPHWFMLASARDWNGSGHDILKLHKANSPTGPWQACVNNPVLLEAGRSEPAGDLFYRGQHLIRPVQSWKQGTPKTLFYSIPVAEHFEAGLFAQKLFAGQAADTGNAETGNLETCPSNEQTKWKKFSWSLPGTSRAIFRPGFYVCDRLPNN